MLLPHSRQPFWGSPPHRRGKAVPIAAVPIAAGITPAWAGKSLGLVRVTLRDRDHPRMGGEKYLPYFNADGFVGSPPHRRGKGGSRRIVCAQIGITPA